jgi:hypothetical protein
VDGNAEQNAHAPAAAGIGFPVSLWGWFSTHPTTIPFRSEAGNGTILLGQFLSKQQRRVVRLALLN